MRTRTHNRAAENPTYVRTPARVHAHTRTHTRTTNEQPGCITWKRSCCRMQSRYRTVFCYRTLDLQPPHYFLRTARQLIGGLSTTRTWLHEKIRNPSFREARSNSKPSITREITTLHGYNNTVVAFLISFFLFALSL